MCSHTPLRLDHGHLLNLIKGWTVRGNVLRVLCALSVSLNVVPPFSFQSVKLEHFPAHQEKKYTSCSSKPRNFTFVWTISALLAVVASSFRVTSGAFWTLMPHRHSGRFLDFDTSSPSTNLGCFLDFDASSPSYQPHSNASRANIALQYRQPVHAARSHELLDVDVIWSHSHQLEERYG